MGRTKVKQPNSQETLAQTLGTQMDFLLPMANREGLDERIEASGLSRSGFLQRAQTRESMALTRQFGPQLIQLQSMLRQQAIDADPLAKASQDASLETIENRRGLSNDLIDRAESGLEDLDNDGLPDDVNRSILESSRSSLASRGINESGAGGVLEAMKLVGGMEQIRSSRLGQAQQILSGAAPLSTPGLALAAPAFQGLIDPSGLVPGANTLAGFAGSALGVQGGLLGTQASLRFQEQQALGQGIGQFGSQVIDMAGGLLGGFGGGIIPGFGT